MRGNVCRKGSVLMEFVIVLPVYLLFFAGVLTIGDILMKTARLSAADRTAVLMEAHEETPAADPLWNRMARMLFPGDRRYPNRPLWYKDDITVTAFQDVLSRGTRHHLADPAFSGAWSWQVAGTVTNLYALAPQTRAMMQFFEYVSHDGMSHPINTRTPNGVFRPLLTKNVLGRAGLVSKDLARPYAAYTLSRTHAGFISYRKMAWDGSAEGMAGILAPDNRWYGCVANEKFADSVPENLEGGSDDRAFPATGLVPRTPYRRNDDFVKWSPE